MCYCFFPLWKWTLTMNVTPLKEKKIRRLYVYWDTPGQMGHMRRSRYFLLCLTINSSTKLELPTLDFPYKYKQGLFKLKKE